MVLTGRHSGDVFAIAHHDETGFLALQKLFNHHPGHGHAVCVLVVRNTQHVLVRTRGQHEFNRLMRFVQSQCHHDTLSRSQTVCLDHDRRAFFVHIGMRSRCVGKRFVLSRRNAVALHEGF